MWKFVFLAMWLVVLSGCQTVSHSTQSIPDPLAAAKNRLALGLTYLKSNNFIQAKYNLDKALDFAPRFADAHFGIAYYHQQVGELALAEDSYQVALNLDESNPDIANSYGAFLCSQGHYVDAQTYFFKAIKNQNYLSTAQTYENLALCSQSQGDIFAAIDYLNKALNHEPTRQQSLYLLAELYASQNQHDQALQTIKSYERVVGPNPDSMFLSFDVALSQGNEQKARGWYNVLSSRYTGHPNTLVAENKLAEFVGHRQQQKDRTNAQKTSDKIIKPVYHTLKYGETLYRLSRIYNVSVFDIMTWNTIAQTDSLPIGMQLIVSYQ